MSSLKDKVAVVTGASKGIGAGIARYLGEAGAAVVVNYASDKAGADRVVTDITRTAGRAIAVHANVAEPADITRLFAETVRQLGRLDVLVNNAGVYDFRPLEDITEEHFHRQFDVNVLGLLLATKEAVKHFGPGGGSIINIGSVGGTMAPPGGSVYAASKAAVDAITRSLSKELGARNIRVNAINPGAIETEGVRSLGLLDSEMGKQMKASIPLGRIGQPRDVAPAVGFLASDEAAWITGETWVIGGGMR